MMVRVSNLVVVKWGLLQVQVKHSHPHSLTRLMFQSKLRFQSIPGVRQKFDTHWEARGQYTK